MKYTTIKEGDTLTSIAQTNNLTLEELLSLNPKIENPNLINVGDRVYLAKKKAAADIPAEPEVTGDSPLNLPAIAEHQLTWSNYQRFTHPILGDITITGGFMESSGHSQKGQLKAIFADKALKTLPPSRRNIGIDYVEKNRKAIAWYSGTVVRQGIEGGYGRRIHIKLNLKFEHQGKEYEVYQAYAHLQQIWVRAGQEVKQGTQIGVMGGSSHNNDNAYPPHIDLSTYIIVGGETVQINPQLIDLALQSD